MKTYFPKPHDKTLTHQWYLIDAKGVILGKLATKIADLLRGKHKAVFTKHVDTGDFVIVTNAKEIKVTGNKMTDKLYRRHSGYFGGLKETTLQDMLEHKPEFVIQEAVKGMLPKNYSRKDYLKKLKVYPGSEHPHTAQQAVEMKI